MHSVQETHGIQNDVWTKFQRKMIMNDEITTQNLVVRPRLSQPPPTHYVSTKILWNKHGEVVAYMKTKTICLPRWGQRGLGGK